MKLIPLGITGLDEILHGGLYKPSTTLIVGDAGAGKTTLIMQMLFYAAKELGERSLYISFASESSDNLRKVISTYSYYDQKLIDDKMVNIICLDANILKDGDMAVTEAIERYINNIKPDKVVIDPITVLEIVSKSFEQRMMDNTEKREFGYNILMKMKQWDTMVMLTSELPKEELKSSMWNYLVDGIIILTDKKINDRRERFIEVTKMRGMYYERGEHSFKITNDGIEIFPHLVLGKCEVKPSSERVNSGIPKLDLMLGGGLIQSSATLIGGNSGVGKSIMGLHFIKEGLESGESALIVSHVGEFEVIDCAKKFGWDFENFRHDGLLSFVFIHPEMMADEIAIKIRNVVSNTNAKRVLFDSYTEYIHRISDTSNIKRHMHSLVSNLKNCNITSMFISNAPTDDKASAVDESIAFMMDNIILLGYIKKGAKTNRSITVLKEHGSDHDKCMREFLITNTGIEIKDVVEDTGTPTNGRPRRSNSNSTDLIKILAVDDDPFILTIIRDILPATMYKVVSAKNGKEALGMVFSESPDLILLDAMMPDMGGHEVIEKLKAHESTAKIPIIMLTAMSDPYDEIKAIEMGVDDYITKPFEPTVLDPRIRMVLRRTYAE